MLTKILKKSFLVATALSLSVACVQMKPEDSGSNSPSSGSSGSSFSGGSNKTFDTSGLLNSRRTKSGRIAMDFTNKRTVDISHLVGGSNVATVFSTNEGGTFSRYETGAPFNKVVKSAKTGGDVLLTITYKDGTSKTYKF